MPYLIAGALGMLGLGGGYFAGKTESTIASVAKGAVVLGAGLYLYKRFK
jgi:uncharacterized membrane protein YjjB (DUF3815 family)